MRFALMILLISLPLMGADVVIFDEATDRVLQFIPSTKTSDYRSRTDALINPDLSSVRNVAMRYWKQDRGGVVEMNASEKATVDSERQTVINDRNAKLASIRAKLKNVLNLADEEIDLLLGALSP